MKRHPGLVAAHYTMLCVLAFLCVAPILVIFATSLRQQVNIFAEPLNFFFTPTLENYRAVIQDDKLDRHLGNSLFVGLVSTIITLVPGCMAAYGLARFRFRGRTTIAYTTLLLRTVPLAVMAVPVFLIWSEWKMVDSLWGLPLMAPGLAAASIFTFRIAWNEFILALVLTDRNTRTLPVAASLFITDIGVDWGKVMAMGSLIAIPPLIFTFVAARQIITGLTAGAVKG